MDRAAYQRAYREEHRERLNAYDKAYREVNRERLNVCDKAYREAHRPSRWSEALVAFQDFHGREYAA